MILEIYFSLDVYALHRWKDCSIEQVDYLRNLHRHQFRFTCSGPVDHDDREKEFIVLKEKLFTFLCAKFWSPKYKMLDFDTLSCEQLCKIVYAEFNWLSSVQVSEDGENGAVLTA